MKIRVTYTTEVPDWWRRAVNMQYGRPGLANREQCRDWLQTYGTSMDDDLSMDFAKIDDKDIDGPE